MNICMHKNKNKQSSSFSTQIFSSFIIFILFVLVFTQLSKDNKSFPQRLPLLILLPALIFPSPSLYLHLALDSPRSPLLLLLGFSFFSNHPPLFSPPLLSSFLFLLMQHSSHSCWLLKGKDPAGRPRPNIITVLSTSLSFSFTLSLFLYHWFYLSIHLLIFFLTFFLLCSVTLVFLIPFLFFTLAFLLPETSILAYLISQRAAACTLTVLKQLTETTVFHN